MRGLSLVVASEGHSSSRCAGLSLSGSTGSRRAGSVIVAHGPSCSVACGIFPDQGSNPCPLHWQADSQPLRHQGNPRVSIILVLRIAPISLEGLDAIKNFEFLKTSAHYLSHSSDLLGKVNSPFPLPVKQNTDDHPRLVCIGLTGLRGFSNVYFT